MSDKLTSGNIGKINTLCLKASFGFGGAWLFWQMATPGFEAFALFAAAYALGGAICAGKALRDLVKLIGRMRTWGRFKSKGVDPKADPIPSEDDLRTNGLTR